MRLAYLIRVKARVQSASELVQGMRARLLTLVAVLVLAGCGGGTRGSGGQFYEGFVGDPAGKSLPNVTVTLLASGDSATSDTQGRFFIETQVLAGSLDLMLEGDGFEATTTTAPIPVGARRVRITLTVSLGQEPRVTSSVEVVERTEAEGDAGRDDDGDNSRDDSEDGARDDDDKDDSDRDDLNDDDDQNDSNDDEGGSGSDDSQDDSSGDSSGGSNGSGEGSDDRDDDGDRRDGDSKTTEGTISRLSSTTVTVSGVDFTVSSASDFRDADGNPTSLSSFGVGQRVEARGRYQAGLLILERLELDD
jgi:hypothetical protein